MGNKRMKSTKNILWLLLLIVATVWILVRHQQQPGFNRLTGLVFGTVYNITYQYDGDLKEEVEEELRRFDFSLSMFNDSSVISRVNRNEPVKVDTFFRTCFNRAIEIADETEGRFDITVAPLVNAWGFGFKQGAFPDSAMVDSLRQLTGYRKVRLVGDSVQKSDQRVMLDCSAVAKGYAVDVVAQLLESKGIKNFMVDIGGEVVVRGQNPDNALWRIGVNKPIDDSLSVRQDLQTVLELTNVGMATSGNYRNFYYKDGKKYAHTINPLTGYPAEQNILSATVVAEDCMTADALATAFMVMGLDDAVAFCEAHPTIDAYFIYDGEDGKLAVQYTEGMKRYLKK